MERYQENGKKLKGNKAKASNFRSISLTSSVCKLSRVTNYRKMIQYLLDNSIIIHYQHGFVPKKSCFTNLLETFEAWTDAVDPGFGVTVIYLDYSKAFDSVPHLRLIGKLSSYGIGGKLILWFKSFLQGRYQRVTVVRYNQWSRLRICVGITLVCTVHQ